MLNQRSKQQNKIVLHQWIVRFELVCEEVYRFLAEKEENHRRKRNRVLRIVALTGEQTEDHLTNKEEEWALVERRDAVERNFDGMLGDILTVSVVETLSRFRLIGGGGQDKVAFRLINNLGIGFEQGRLERHALLKTCFILELEAVQLFYFAYVAPNILNDAFGALPPLEPAPVEEVVEGLENTHI